MIDPDLAVRLDEIAAKADAAYRAAEKVRRYLFWTGVVTVALIILPMIGLVFAIPAFMSSYVAPLQQVSGSSGSIQDTVNTLNSLGL